MNYFDMMKIKTRIFNLHQIVFRVLLTIRVGDMIMDAR